VLLSATTAALANDRPYLLTSNAVAEDDDNGVWAVEAWWQKLGRMRALTVAPEYAFNPHNSLQLQLTRARDHDSGERETPLEVEYKHVFNQIERDGYGIGAHLSLDTGREDGSRWRWQRFSARGLLSVPLPGTDGDGLLHVNAGVAKPRDARREWLGSLALQHKLPWRSTAFVELGREARQTLWHTGVRHWIKRERLAVDVSVQRVRGDGAKHNGVVIGVGWYDL
jgi:hypothetical protein